MNPARAIPPGTLPAPPPGQDDLPYDDGMPLESDKHRRQMTLLIQTLGHHLRGDRKAFVGGNMGIYYSLLQVARHEVLVPDVFVVLDAELDRERKSWVVWEEGAAPVVVIELLSDSTAAADRGRKMIAYGKSLKVDEYYLYDPRNGDLQGHRRRSDGTYRAVPSKGGCDSPALGLRLAVWRGPYEDHDTFWLRWALPDGTPLPTPQEVADAERIRADAERIRADEERIRADEERVRADEERTRADAARSRAETLAERLRSLGVDPEG